MNPLGTSGDEELAELAQSGSAAAYDALVERHTPVVYRVAYGITRSAVEAEDVVQETFLRAFRHLDRFSPAKANFRTWLLTIARNQSINILSSLRRKAVRLVSGDPGDDFDAPSDLTPRSAELSEPERLLSMKQEYHRVREAIRQLPERQRTALLLKAEESLSYDEIAEIMEASASSVESLIFRARKKLLETLKD
jgi:RNA polymerase sigma factor (sigma-70 family)